MSDTNFVTLFLFLRYFARELFWPAFCTEPHQAGFGEYIQPFVPTDLPSSLLDLRYGEVCLDPLSSS